MLQNRKLGQLGRLTDGDLYLALLRVERQPNRYLVNLVLAPNAAAVWNMEMCALVVTALWVGEVLDGALISSVMSDGVTQGGSGVMWKPPSRSEVALALSVGVIGMLFFHFLPLFRNSWRTLSRWSWFSIFSAISAVAVWLSGLIEGWPAAQNAFLLSFGFFAPIICAMMLPRGRYRQPLPAGLFQTGFEHGPRSSNHRRIWPQPFSHRVDMGLRSVLVGGLTLSVIGLIGIGWYAPNGVGLIDWLVSPSRPLFALYTGLVCALVLLGGGYARRRGHLIFHKSTRWLGRAIDGVLDYGSAVAFLGVLGILLLPDRMEGLVIEFCFVALLLVTGVVILPSMLLLARPSITTGDISIHTPLADGNWTLGKLTSVSVGVFFGRWRLFVAFIKRLIAPAKWATRNLSTVLGPSNRQTSFVDRTILSRIEIEGSRYRYLYIVTQYLPIGTGFYIILLAVLTHSFSKQACYTAALAWTAYGVFYIVRISEKWRSRHDAERYRQGLIMRGIAQPNRHVFFPDWEPGGIAWWEWLSLAGEMAALSIRVAWIIHFTLLALLLTAIDLLGG